MSNLDFAARLDTFLKTEFNNWAPHYEGDTIRLHYTAHQAVVNRVGAIIPRNAPAPAVIDLGTGTGLVIRGLKEILPAAQFRGFDYAQEMIRHCQRNNPGVALDLWDLRKEVWPIAANSADIVTSAGLMDFINNPDKFLNNVQMIMKPGAVAVLTYEANRLTKKSMISDLDGRHPQCPDRMAQHAEKAGLSVEENNVFDGYIRYGSGVPYGLMTLRKPAP